jgi:hypothetical protein
VEWPGSNIGGGRDVNTLTKDIDLLPTLVDLCGLENHGTEPDGHSLRPLLLGSTTPTGASWPDRTLFVDSQRDELLQRWRQGAVMTQRWRLVNPTPNGDPSKLELYDITRDPGQQNNIAGKHADVVDELSRKYDAWWAGIAPQNAHMVRIVLGDDRDNPACLTCMDWHSPDANNVWHQRQILTGPVANGFWAVDVSRPGRYRFELRRWPREIDSAINATYHNPPDNKEQASPSGQCRDTSTSPAGIRASQSPSSPDSSPSHWTCPPGQPNYAQRSPARISTSAAPITCMWKDFRSE